jgi:hypothetical protein
MMPTAELKGGAVLLLLLMMMMMLLMLVVVVVCGLSFSGPDQGFNRRA